MAEETTTVTPKQMGSHLRAVRRRKGLSLSEVARGAGLNRRELVNYERGKSAIPESDLWVLAGSIGVDISEMMPPATPGPDAAPSENVPALRRDTGAESIGDAVAMLRRSNEDHESSPLLGTLRMLQQLPEGKRVPLKDRQLTEIAADLGETPAAIESSIATILGCDAQEAARVRAILLSVPHQGHGRRGRRAKALGAAEAEPVARYQAPVVPPPAPSEPEPTEHAAVDVFEELARLPEPLPLPEETSLPDIIATPPDPEGAVELVDHDTFPSLGDRFGFKQPAMAESAASASAAGAATVLRSGADAPPIDVAMRTDDWSFSTPPSTPTGPNGPTRPTSGEPLARRPVPGGSFDGGSDRGSDDFVGGGWEPPAPEGGATPSSFWEGTDEWTPAAAATSDTVETVETVDAIDTVEVVDAGVADAVAADAPTVNGTDPNGLWSFEPAAVDPWIAGGWPESNASDASAPGGVEMIDSEWPSSAFTPVDDTSADPAEIWGDAGGPAQPVRDFAVPAFAAAELVDPEVVDTPSMAAVDDTAVTDEPVDTTPWEHTLDPAAVDSGFIVDWGEADDAEPDPRPGQQDDTMAGQWATTGTFDEPLTPTWEVRTGTTDATAAEAPAEATAPAHETFDAYDAFAADPFAAATEAVEAVETDEAVEEVEVAPLTEADGTDVHGFSFGSDLAAALAATYLPDGSEQTEAPEAPEAFTAAEASAVVEVEAEFPPFDPTPEEFEATFEPFDGFESGVADGFETEAAFEPEPEPEPEPGHEFEATVDDDTETELAVPAPVAELPRIVWRADASGNVDVADDSADEAADDTIAEAADETPAAAEPEPVEAVFVTAGQDWQLGNAVPLVEVKSEGALVMRRADERWALADVTTNADFVLEVDVDFRSGPGLGVLFRASVDELGRMSGYSFDIDPIYDGGGFLVRQWQDDRELWNPIARVAATDPNAMYGRLTVRLELHGETLTAAVNGAEVMTVDDLAQASVERDREAARGERVGVQAWSSSDLVIDTLRVANH